MVPVLPVSAPQHGQQEATEDCCNPVGSKLLSLPRHKLRPDDSAASTGAVGNIYRAGQQDGWHQSATSPCHLVLGTLCH